MQVPNVRKIKGHQVLRKQSWKIPHGLRNNEFKNTQGQSTEEREDLVDFSENKPTLEAQEEGQVKETEEVLGKKMAKELRKNKRSFQNNFAGTTEKVKAFNQEGAQ